MKIKILYEDSNILAIDKPSGISVHADGRSKRKTIADWILKNYPRMKNVGEDEVYENKKVKTEIKKPGIVHRLDRETSGVLLLAKNEKTYQLLKKQFQDRIVKKTYIAIVNGHLKNDRGIINNPIGRSPTDFRRYLAGRGARGEMREALTEYTVLKRIPKFTIVNHPVACDTLYNPGAACPKGIKRLALHAKSIEFKDPKGKLVKIESKLPKEFEGLLKQ